MGKAERVRPSVQEVDGEGWPSGSADWKKTLEKAADGDNPWLVLWCAMAQSKLHKCSLEGLSIADWPSYCWEAADGSPTPTACDDKRYKWQRLMLLSGGFRKIN